jgi:hypothetical protein
MNNEGKGNSLEPEDIPSVCTGSKLETTKSLDAGPEGANPDVAIAGQTPEAMKAIEQPVEADRLPSLSVGHEPRTDEAASSVAVKSVFVERPQSFFREKSLPIIEMTPRVLRYRTRRDLLLFSAGAVAAAAGAGVLLPQATLSRMGCATKFQHSREGMAAEQGIAYRR